MIKRGRFEQINVIPLVDVVLVLLVIVLSTSTFLNSSISVDLPSSTAKSKKISKDVVTIVITKDNRLFFDDTKVEYNDIKSKIAEYEKSQKYTIKGDKKSNFENFVLLVDIFKSLGIKNVSIVTKR